MSNIYKGELQDNLGNTVYPHTEADVVFCTDGESMQSKISNYEEALGNVTGTTDSAEVNDPNLLATSKALNNLKTSLEESFQDGCDTLVEKCVALGVTPDSNSPDDISNAMQTIADNLIAEGRVGTAEAAHVLSGYTFSNSDASGIAGEMPNNGALNWSGSNTTKAVSAGYYSGGTLDSRPSYNAGYTAGNSAGVAATKVGTAVAANVLTGKTFTNSSGVGLTGTMTNKSGTAAVSATPSVDTTNSRVKMAIPANGYYATSNFLYTAFSTLASKIGLTAAKLLKGQTVLGITGTGDITHNVYAKVDANADSGTLYLYVDGEKKAEVGMLWSAGGEYTTDTFTI